MKILFMTTCLDYSGAPKMMAWVANRMAKKGHEVHLVTFFKADQAKILCEDVVAHSLDVERSQSKLVRNTTGMLKAVTKLHRTVRRVKPDIVVSFLDSVGYTYLPIGRFLTRAKFVASERVDPYSYKGKTSKLRFFLMGYAHGSVFQTDGAREFFKDKKRIYDGSTVIPNPVVLNEKVRGMQKNIPSYEERDKRIVTVGRLSLRQKRQDVLFDAFKIFHESHPDYKLVVYGDGEDTEKIQALADAKGLSDCVVLAGRTDKVEEEIFNAKAFVLTSDFEGIPNALIEAMSLGVPSVSTDCSPGGAALLINDGENGFLVPKGDAKAIAERLSAVVDDKSVSSRFSQNAPSVSNRFSEDIIEDKWEGYFLSILGKYDVTAH